MVMTNAARVIKELEGWTGRACVVEVGGRHYVVSSITPRDEPLLRCPETLAFESDENGNVAKYSEVAGGKNMTREETIAELEER